jgi:hypothetical protein
MQSFMFRAALAGPSHLQPLQCPCPGAQRKLAKANLHKLVKVADNEMLSVLNGLVLSVADI